MTKAKYITPCISANEKWWPT